jgi:hypothetical protein
MVVGVLASIHRSYRPPSKAWWPSFQPCARSLYELQTELVRVGPERQHVLGAVGLVPHRLAAGQRHRVPVAETAYPAQRSEVVVERPVLLHQDDDVLDVAQGSGTAVRRDARRPGDARGQD